MSNKTQNIIESYKSQYAKKIQSIITEITQLYANYGENYKYGKRTYLEHAIISAAMAESSHQADTFVLAALLHDIGYLVLFKNPEGKDSKDPQSIGACWLRDRCWPDLLADTIQHYILAAQYIMFFDKNLLELKVSPMTELQARDFEQNEHFDHYIDLALTDYLAAKSDFDVSQIEELWSYYAKKMVQYLTCFYQRRNSHIFKTPLSPIAELSESK